MVIEMCDFLKPTNWLFIQLNLKKKKEKKNTITILHIRMQWKQCRSQIFHSSLIHSKKRAK